jgi:S1-C subfamily serine protease
MQLSFIQGAFAGRDVELTAIERYTIGRADGCDLRVPDDDKRASRQHAEIVRRDGNWFIRDLNSSNGVWIDGQQISDETLLRDGQTVRVGAQYFQVSAVAQVDGATEVVDQAAVVAERERAERERKEREAAAAAAAAAEQRDAAEREAAAAAAAEQREAAERERNEREAAAAEQRAAEERKQREAKERAQREAAERERKEREAAAAAAAAEERRTRDEAQHGKQERHTRLPRQRGYTTLFRRQSRQLRTVTIIACVAVLAAVGVGVAAAAGVFSGSSNSDEIDVAQIVRNAKPSVLLVNMNTTPQIGHTLGLKDNRTSSGSGWVIDAKNGYVVTNGHVVFGGQSITVAPPGGKAREAKLVGVNLCQDVALLKVTDTSGLKSLQEVPQSQLSQGDPVVALGFPGTLSEEDNLSTTSGVISVVNSKVGGDYPDVVQTDTAINHGNSGGPLLNADGKVVGMNTLGDPDTQNQNFAIASDHINSLLGDIERGVNHAWLGWYLEYLADDPSQPLVKDDAGNAYYGPAVVGPTAGHGSEGVLQGMAGGKDQYVYAIDGHKFGSGDDDIPPGTDAMTALCAVAGDKKTGDTVKLGVLTHDGSGWSANDVDVKLK